MQSYKAMAQISRVTLLWFITSALVNKDGNFPKV